MYCRYIILTFRTWYITIIIKLQGLKLESKKKIKKSEIKDTYTHTPLNWQNNFVPSFMRFIYYRKDWEHILSQNLTLLSLMTMKMESTFKF